MSCFDSNLEILARRQPRLAEHLHSVQLEKVKIFSSASGLPAAVYHQSAEKIIPLHSKYHPLRDARAKLREYDIANSDYVVFLGFGLGYLLDAALESELAREKKYFIVESDAQILRAALEARDLESILTLPSIHFAWPVSETALSHQWHAFFDPVHAQQCVYVMHPPSLAVNPEFYKGAAKVIQSQTMQIFADINTLIARSELFLENFVKNIRHALPAPGVAAFSGLLRESPCVLVSAGPSLDKNIHELSPFQEKAVILSTDTALKPLLNAGIEPHFVTTGDPAEANYLHLKDARAPNAYLIAEVTTYPASFEEFRGRTVCCVFEGSILKSLSDLMGNKGRLKAWGSVATMALDFALLLGCNPIIFVGQDLAYSDGRTYCSGVYFIEDCFRDVAGPEAWQQRWELLRSQAQPIVVPDVFGRPVETTKALLSYWNWFAKELPLHPEIRFINATEGGILKENVEVISLREALYRHCSQDRNIREQIKTAFNRAAKSRPGHFARTIAQFRKESREIHRLLGEGKTICSSGQAASPTAARKELEAIKLGLSASTRLADLLDIFNQMGNVVFLRRMADLGKAGIAETGTDEIRRAYSDFLDSIAQTIGKIDSALDRIEQALA